MSFASGTSKLALGFLGGQRCVVAMVWDERLETTERFPPGE